MNMNSQSTDFNPFYSWLNFFFSSFLSFCLDLLCCTQINCKNILHCWHFTLLLRHSNNIKYYKCSFGHFQSVQYYDFDWFSIDFDWSSTECLIVIKWLDLINIISNTLLLSSRKRHEKKNQSIWNNMKSHDIFCRRISTSYGILEVEK